MFFEAVKEVLALNFGFFIDLILDNLLWVFAFLVANHVIFKGKQLLLNFVLFSFDIWSFREFGHIWGLQGFTINPFFFFVYMVFMRIFIIEPKTFGKYTGFVDIGGFYLVIFVLNFFLR